MAVAKRDWRKISLESLAQEAQLQRKTFRILKCEKWRVMCYFFALILGSLLFAEPGPVSQVPAFPLVALFGISGAIVYNFFIGSKPPLPVTSVDQHWGPGPADAAWIGGTMASAAMILKVFGRQPLSAFSGFFTLTLLMDISIAVLGYWVLRLVKRRLSADPSIARILRQNAVSFHQIRPHRSFMASRKDQRATSHQDLVIARRARLGKTLWGIAIAASTVITVAIIMTLALRRLEKGMLVVMGIAVLALSVLFERRAARKQGALTQVIKRQAAASAASALQDDQRPPVLLLRSFADDATTNGTDRFEETIAPILALYGPIVAIGDPKDTLPLLGAYRDYVNESNWQEHVRAYIRAAKVIVMIPGHSHWIQWELGEILEGDFLNKVILVFPPGQSQEESTKRLTATWRAFQQRTDLLPLDTRDLPDTVAMHFFDPQSITSITDQYFRFGPRGIYHYSKALLAAFSGPSASFYLAKLSQERQ